MPSEAQKRADRKYKRDKTQQFCLRFYPGDSEVWNYLSAQDNKQGFLKGLISREMEQAPVAAGARGGMRASGDGADVHGESVRASREESVRRGRAES